MLQNFTFFESQKKKAVQTGILLSALISSGTVLGQEEEEVNLDEAALLLEEFVIDFDLKDLLNISDSEEESSPLILYGYIRTNVEKVFQIPGVDSDGNTVTSDSPLEWSNPNFHLFGSSKINENIDVEFNLFGEQSDFEVRTAWANLRYNDLAQIKVGKQYRRFGLFNEKLDHIPVFIGIEPPELLDQDHLLLPRFTEFSFHGEFPFAEGTVSYMVDTDNPESGPSNGTHPVGLDVRYKQSNVLFGFSAYQSSIGDGATQSTVALGEGSPRGGVLPWMSGDEYSVFGAYIETAYKGAIIQTAIWQASHDATRDPASVLEVVRNAGINQAQRDRFLGINSSKDDIDLLESDVVTDADYDVKTAYFRVGYPITHEWGTFIPYFHWDWMENPENIKNKTYGGDNEVGFADDGEFTKYSVGLVFKPTDGTAIKFDSSIHEQKFNGRTERYPEIRLDFSYAFKM